MPEKPPNSGRNEYGNEHGDGESDGIVLHAVDEVHAEERRDERGKHHHNRHRGECTHHRVHVVVDDARIGIHRRLKDVAVDVGCFPGLAHLDVDVFDEVGVQLVNL